MELKLCKLIESDIPVSSVNTEDLSDLSELDNVKAEGTEEWCTREDPGSCVIPVHLQYLVLFHIFLMTSQH